MTTNIEMTQELQSPPSPFKKLLWVGALAMAAATVASLGLYAVTGNLFPEVTAWPGAGPGQIVGANIVYLLIGTLIFALVSRYSSRPARHYLIVAAIGLILSFGLPISAIFSDGASGVPPADVATADSAPFTGWHWQACLP